MTVIADDRQVHDIGGIMGGEDSGVGVDTTDVMLEVAYFTPERIARTGQALGLTSDARSRFERGVDPAFLDDGLAILTGLILDICGGEASAALRVGEPPDEKRTIEFDFARTKALGGIDVPEQRQREILQSLGFEFDSNRVTVPTWRRDVDGPADLVEEVARITGYDQVPSTPLPREAGVARPTATRSQLVERRVRRTAAARGLDEAVTWSFISETEAEAFGGADWRLANPISEEMKAMRPSLLPGLIAAARRNLDRGAARSACSRSDAAIWAMTNTRRSACCLPANASRAAGSPARHAASTRSTPRPKCWRYWRLRVLRPRASRSFRARVRPGTPADRPGLAWVPGRSSQHSANSTRALPRPSMRRRAQSPRRSISTPFQRHAQAGAPGPFSPLRRCRRLPATSRSSFRRTSRPTVSFGRSAAPTRVRLVTCDCSTASRLRTGSAWRSKSRSSPPTRASPTSRSGKSRRASLPLPKIRSAPQELVRAR